MISWASSAASVLFCSRTLSKITRRPFCDVPVAVDTIPKMFGVAARSELARIQFQFRFCTTRLEPVPSGLPGTTESVSLPGPGPVLSVPGRIGPVRLERVLICPIGRGMGGVKFPRSSPPLSPSYIVHPSPSAHYSPVTPVLCMTNPCITSPPPVDSNPCMSGRNNDAVSSQEYEPAVCITRTRPSHCRSSQPRRLATRLSMAA